jgi:hypothetical protein
MKLAYTIGVKSIDTNSIDKTINEVSAKLNVHFDHKTLSSLSFNKGWTALIIPGEEISITLIEILSKELQTIVIAFFEFDTVGVVELQTYINGDFKDQLSVADFEVSDKLGYFSDAPDTYDSYDEIYEKLGEYFQKVGFDPTSAEVLENK